MGWNSIEDCYNTGTITIREEGFYDTYGIAGDTLDWTCSVTGCVSLKGTTTGQMRHESVMELDKEDMEKWLADPESIPYAANNWQFDLKEAKEKLPLVPLGVKESPLTRDKKDIYLCEEFILQAPEGFVISQPSPYALSMEAETSENSGGSGWPDSGYQVWLLRLEPGQAVAVNEAGFITEEAGQELWQNIPGLFWLHPSYSHANDVHITTHNQYLKEMYLGSSFCLTHYRDDILAALAVGDEGEHRIDNVVVLVTEQKEEGKYGAEWLLLFTNGETNYRPPLSFVKEVMETFTLLPCENHGGTG